MGVLRMIRNKSKILAVFVIIPIIVSLAVTATYASNGYKRTLEAWFGMTNIRYNNQDLTTYAEPFSWNETTYIPLRKMCDIFNKDIRWEQATQTVVITDKQDTTEIDLRNQIIYKDIQIAELQERIKELEKGKVIDIDDLEDELNDDYGTYRKIKFSIRLSGDEEDVTVKISVDLKKYGDEWNSLTRSRKLSYLQDICDDILEEYEDAEIEGYIRDSSKSGTYKLLSFETNSRGKVSIEERGEALSDLAEDLEDEYYDYFRGIKFDSFELEGDEDEIVFIVNIDLRKYDDEWEDLSNRKIENFMNRIREEILDEYEDASVDGYIFDIYEDEDAAELLEVSGGGTKFKRRK
jgi:hypothetical protein